MIRDIQSTFQPDGEQSISPMRTLVAWVTRRCNLRCQGCYMSAGDGPQDDLQLDVFDAALAALPFASGWGLQIAGGEPSMVPDIVDQIATSARLHGAERFSIQTNGIGVDDAFISMLKRHKFNVGVSLDGTPKINELLRGGTAQVLMALERFETLGYPVSITTVVSHHNVNDLPRLGALLARYECVRTIGLDIVRPIGRASNDWLPKPVDLKNAYNELADVLDWANTRRRYPLIIRESCFVDLPNAPKSYCPAAIGQSAVLIPDGTLYPCSSCVGDDQFVCGTVFNPDFERLSLGLNAPAAGCEKCFVSGCRGRCPSRSLSSVKAGFLDCVLRRAEWERRQARHVFHSHSEEEVCHAC